MGTNYYLHEQEDCECCGQSRGEVRHIGKSSGGWCFSLHVIPWDGLNTLEDWKAAWSQPGAFIKSEYGDSVPPEVMLEIITKREWNGGPRRHPVDGRHCTGHGEGTWDYITGDFS